MTETGTAARTARDRIETGERVVSLSEAADLLSMKRSNTAKFLARRGVEPAFPKAQGYFWWLADVERAKAEREQNKARMAADAQRRDSALNGRPPDPDPPPPELARLGSAQRDLALVLLRHPVEYPKDARRFALRRLRQRGLVEPVPGASTWQATARLREIASWL
jgi:hypothetical protein